MEPPTPEPVRLVMDAAAIEAFVSAEFPQARALGFRIDEVGAGGVTLALPIDDRHLRPGDTVSGPTLMALADTALYFAILSRLGPVRLAVTTDMTMHFIRRPSAREVLARAELLKLGARLAVGEVHLRADGSSAPIAHAVATYSLPPARGG